MAKFNPGKSILNSDIHSSGVIEFGPRIFGPGYKNKIEKDMKLSIVIHKRRRKT